MNLKVLMASIWLCATGVAAGCAMETSGEESASQDATEQRGALGKADAYGSCKKGNKTLCGGKGTGKCWCDDECADYGDCCANVESVCGIGCPDPNDPDVGYFSQDPNKCATIKFFCAPGHVPFSGECGCGCKKEEPKTCGGFLGQTCGTGEWCDYEGTSCGFADQTGVCKTKPDACAEIYAPVCGCNGKTYGNACEASIAGVDVKKNGACTDSCGGCGSGKYCSYCWGQMQCIPNGAVC